MTKFFIQVFSERCTGCRLCQLACSEHYSRAFTPHAAGIQVVVNGADCSIEFTEKCNHCGICADYCFYGALEKSPLDAGHGAAGQEEAAG